MRSPLVFLLLSALTLAACGDEAPGLGAVMSPAQETQTATIAGLDSLVREGTPFSVNGQVLEQEEGARRLLLDDGTGLLWVELPEAPPRLVGRRLFARGPLEREGDGLVLEAVEWLYDSTAISIHSD